MKITGLPPDPSSHAISSDLKLVHAAGSPPRPPAAIAEKKLPHGHTVEISPEAQIQISNLKARDRQVHQHEQAHLSASGGLNVSNASFTYQRGPNGVNYAVSGEVKIDTSPGRTPEDTLARAELIREVALAPADPSAVDRSVAAKAQNMAMQARIEIMQEANNAAINHKYDKSDAPATKNIDTFA